MSVTILELTSCEVQSVPVRSDKERIPLSALPKLTWVALGLLTTNLVIGIGMFLASNIEADPYGTEVQTYDAASSKIYPFTETVDTKHRKVRAAAKLFPVEFVVAPQVAPQEEFVASAASEFEQERSRQLDIPRTSQAYQQLDLPVRTERAVYSPGESSKTLGTYRSERPSDTKIVVIN